MMLTTLLSHCNLYIRFEIFNGENISKKSEQIMKRKDIKEAKRLWEELRESISKRPSPFEGMTEEEAIKQLRKIRKSL